MKELISKETSDLLKLLAEKKAALQSAAFKMAGAGQMPHGDRTKAQTAIARIETIMSTRAKELANKAKMN